MKHVKVKFNFSKTNKGARNQQLQLVYAAIDAAKSEDGEVMVHMKDYIVFQHADGRITYRRKNYADKLAAFLYDVA